MSVSAVRSGAVPRASDRSLVRVSIALGSGGRVDLGDATAALRDRRLTAAERAAVDALVRAVMLLRVRDGFAGIDDAGTAVRLVLRDREADSGGPWATNGEVNVGARNALVDRDHGRARPGMLLPVDVALHELVHVVQFARMPKGAHPHSAIMEGIADAAAMLATDDDTLGEGYYRVDADGRPRGAVRELGARRASGPPVGGIVTTYEQATRTSTEAHAAGGVVSATFRSLRGRIGRERAEALLWRVVRDPQAWTSGGSWRSLADAIRRAAVAGWPDDPTVASAAAAALHDTGLDEARADD